MNNTNNANNINNDNGLGRVSLKNQYEKPYNFMEEVNTTDTKQYDNSLKYIHTENLLTKIFFSKENIKMIQNMLRYNIWLNSDKKHIISDQDETQLTIIMRSIFLQYSKNIQYDIKSQVKQLNKYVLDWCIPKVLSQVQQFIGYKNDITQSYKPLPYGKYSSSAGTKTLQIDPFL